MPDIKFGPNLSGDVYVSVHYHQAVATPNNNKSQWCVAPPEEYELFNLADERVVKEGQASKPKWECEGFLYSFRNGMKDVIGSTGQRIGKFDSGSSANEWHGYPTKQPKLSEALINEWLSDGLISPSTKQKLLRRKI